MGGTFESVKSQDSAGTNERVSGVDPTVGCLPCLSFLLVLLGRF